MARLVTVECPKCGGSVEIYPKSEYVTCRYCGSQSFVERPGTKTPPPPGAQVVRLSKAQARTLVGGIAVYLVGGLGLTVLLIVGAILVAGIAVAWGLHAYLGMVELHVRVADSCSRLEAMGRSHTELANNLVRTSEAFECVGPFSRRFPELCPK